MGSTSDWPTMGKVCEVLEELEIPFEKRVVSAHRTPDEMFGYAESAQERGLEVIIAGAGVQPTCRGWWPQKRCCLSLECRSNPLL